ncbi:MAG TPA: glycoside hydrolase family 2 TIM barrel-domain containing protein [Pyrinomonadaceae bacterium]|nr:glycoside hydrolase family 2 TIM barrel-domain containing protein [Pyrinomonadaceae bacterium]
MELSPQTIPRPEYPRPQLCRADWLNLNGWWEFAFDDADEGGARQWWDGRTLDRRILVPFPYQSALSGINDKAIHEVVWYARSFEVPSAWHAQEELLLHFGAVDYSTTVWINGQEVGRNASGGHVPFSFNIAPYVRAGTNRLTVRVRDAQTPTQPRGKQSPSGKPVRIYYYCTTGIWQTVWLEPASAARIRELNIETPAPLDTLDLTVQLHGAPGARRLEISVFENLDSEEIVAQAVQEIQSNEARVALKIPDSRAWSPQTPHLYKLRLRLLADGKLLDEVDSYAGLRTIERRGQRLLLNGREIYLAMVMDQGYWPESYLAAPSDAALREDVEWVRRFGFNSVRKHQKIEDPRWLYWCDRLGVLVWAEMPNAMKWSMEGEENLLAEWERAVRRDRNHPSIITWVPVNETMGFRGIRKHRHDGQRAFLERVVTLTRALDPTRLIVDNDGWEHSNLTDICTIHDYTPDLQSFRARYREALSGGLLPQFAWHRRQPLFLSGAEYRGQPIMLSEVGGFLMLPPDVPEHRRDRLYKNYGYCATAHDFLQKYCELMEALSSFKFISGFCYTQLTDIEQEANGLLSYDRQPKIAPEKIAEIHGRLLDIINDSSTPSAAAPCAESAET